MNILHVGKYFSPFRGGLESYLRDLVLALARREISSCVLVHRHGWSVRTQDSTVAIDGHPIRVVRVATWIKLFFTPLSPCFRWHMLRLITEFQPDILHLHLPNPSVLWTLTLPRARRIPWVVHWHSDIVTESQGWPMRVLYHLYRPLEQAVLHRARAIIVTSGDYLASSEPLQHWLAKCRVVPLGMDPGRLQIEGLHPRETAEQAPGLRVLAVGRLTYYKGLRYLIQAVAAVDTVRLDLVGDGDQATELKTLAARLGLQNRVTFHGLLDDQALARLIAGSDCLCLPSIERTEAFGMVLLEAMSFGRATVVSDVAGSGMGYVVDHGITGLKVQPKDAESLATAFRQLASDRTLLRKMGRAGKEKFENLFEINRAVAGVEDTYRVVLEDQAGNGEKAAWSR